MLQNLGTSLWITLIGMGLVFAAILLFWLLMTVLVWSSRRGPSAAKEKEPILLKTDREGGELELKRRAAVAAVAVALARMGDEGAKPFPAPPTAPIRMWQAVMRSRRTGQRGSLR